VTDALTGLEPTPPAGPRRGAIVAIALGGAAVGAAIVAVAGGGSGTTKTVAVAAATTTVTQTVAASPAVAATTSAPKRSHRTTVHIPGVGRDGGVTFSVHSIRTVPSVRVNGFTKPIKSTSKTAVVLVDLTYKNTTSAPIDPFCGERSIVLLNTAHQTFQPDRDEIGVIGNTMCAGKLQPGLKAAEKIPFVVPRGTKPGGFVVWNADNEANFDGSKSSVVFEK
jgi:hypothetical protein